MDPATDLTEAISEAASELGYTLKRQQQVVVSSFVAGNDVFVALPTGFGKSLCYGCLPGVFKRLSGKNAKLYKVIVVSPLTALMADQVEFFKRRGVLATSVTGKTNPDGVLNGEYELVYISPELLLRKKCYRMMGMSEAYSDSLVALVVDEAHCVKKWGEDFRKEFSYIGEVRSILPNSVKLMALTATATKTLRDAVINTLGMVNPIIVSESPDKPNLVLSVHQYESMEESFKPLVDKLHKERTSMGRTLVYCRTQDACAQLYLWFSCCLGGEKTDPPNAPDIPKYRLFDMFTACTHPDVKADILHNITSEQSPLRLVIATIAFGMGINTSNIRTVIHLGPPEDIEQYVQAIGRGGRDGNLAHAVLLVGTGLRRHVGKDMKAYCENSDACRRSVLFQDFDEYHHDPVQLGCKCCDICRLNCVCGNCIHENIFTYS